jgi:hypothetical protein
MVHAKEPGEDSLDADHDNVPLRVHPLNDMVGDTAPPSLVCWVLDAELNFTSAEELGTFHEVEQRQAMCEEMRTIQDNNTWELSTLPTGHWAIGLKWVYKVKRNEAGDIVHHMDVKSVFLNGMIKEEVYVQQPLGFIIAGSKGKMLRLHKVLYGLQ